MRICHAIFSSPWNVLSGGGQLAVHELASASALEGHEVHAVYSAPSGWSRPPDRLPYVAHVTTQRSWRHYNLDAFEHAMTVRRLLRSARFDIVYGHSVNAVLLPDVCRSAGVPFVYVFHDTRLADPAQAAPLRAIFEWDYHLIRRALRVADDVVVFSDWSRHLLARADVRATDRIHRERPGLGAGWFAVPRVTGPTPIVLHWGRLAPTKNVDVLLEAFAQVVREFPTAQLRIAGVGSSERVLRRMAHDLGIAPRVVWLGRLAPNAIQAECATATVAAFPTQVESFGLAIAEACAARLPTIATRSGSIPELISHGENGLLVPPRSVAALADALARVLSDPAPYQQMAYCPGEVVRGLDWRRTARALCARHSSLPHSTNATAEA